MKPYPSIPGGVRHGVPVYVFDKLDGSNVRMEWTRKKGFWKFGRRNGLLDDSVSDWFEYPSKKGAEDVKALMLAQADNLERVFRAQRWQKATAYFEFHGPSSFAGTHQDEEHKVTLLDVAVHPKGMLPPKVFLKLFGHMDLPRLLHHGNFTRQMQEDVSNGDLAFVTFEGVVCKGAPISPGRPLMFKWKSQAWLDRLRGYCGDNDDLFRRLS